MESAYTIGGRQGYGGGELGMLGFDKVLHFVVSFLIGQVSPGLAYAAGWGKELFDLATGGFIDVGDLIADGLGVLTAILVFP